MQMGEEGRTAGATRSRREQRTPGYFTALVEQSSDIIVAIDRHGLVQYVSRAFEQLLGRQRSWSDVGDAFALVHPDDRATVEADFAKKVVDPDGGEPITFRMKHADGTYRHVEASGTNLLDDPDVGAVVVALRDVTARVAAVEDARRSAEHYRQLADLSPMPIAIHQDGRVVYVNGSAARLLAARDPAEIVGRDIADFVHPASLGEVRRRAEVALREGRSVPMVEEQLLRVDGSVLHVEVSAAPTVWDGAAAVQVIARDISDRKAAEAALVHQAHHDALTGLPNRSTVLDRLEVALRSGDPDQLAVVFLDLDRFKIVNDALGHAVGDELLVAVSRRLAGAVRSRDVLGRLGGDEFVILLDGTSTVSEAEALVRRVLASLEEPFVIHGRRIQLSASAGLVVGVGAGDGATSPTDVLRDADTAMYAAKRRGTAQFCTFDPTMRAAARQRIDTEQQLRDGLAAGQLGAWFQPEVDLVTGAVAGVEALVRWKHPTRGLVLPSEFLPVAEDAGLASSITRVVVEDACSRVAGWRALGTSLPGRLPWASVNLAAADLVDGQLARWIGEALERHRLPEGSLCVEVTESALIAEPSTAASTLTELRSLGVRIAIDDFGTGYSSLSYLKRFRPDFVKIDRTFVDGVVDDADDRALVQATIDVARALGIQTIAEGVEDDRQRALLTDLGCELGQGWLFGRPVPSAG